MSDFITSHIRTFVPVLAGTVLSWLAAKGFELDLETQNNLVMALTGATIAVYYFIARQIEKRYPSAGKFLLGSSAQPSYKEIK